MEWRKLKDKIPKLKLGDYIMMAIIDEDMPTEEFYKYIETEHGYGFLSMSNQIDKKCRGVFYPEFDHGEYDSYWDAYDPNKKIPWRYVSNKEKAMLNLLTI